MEYDESVDIGGFSYDVKTAAGYEVKGAGNTSLSTIKLIQVSVRPVFLERLYDG